jgi:hypothetical protein
MADPIGVAVCNQSTTILDSEIAPIVAALQEDISQNGSLWALPPVTLRQITRGAAAPAGWWQLVFLDDSDQADALGYHELTIEGLPIGYVFVRTTTGYGSSVSRVASHELWEMLVDPYLNRYTAPCADGKEYCVEVGDLLSLDSQGRQGLGGVMLSGVALPATYFAGQGTRYDIGGLLTAPLPNVQPPDGAYLMWRGGSSWASGAAHFIHAPVLDAAAFMAMQPQRMSRRHRRILGAANWRMSTIGVQ